MMVSQEHHYAVNSSGHRAEGFTLFEVLVVLAVLTLLIAITWPAVNRYTDEYRLRDAAAEFRTQLYDTRQQAITQGATVSLRYQDKRKQYEITSAELASNIVKTLPETITFRANSETASVADNPAQAATPSAPVFGNAIAATDSSGWQRPIQFLPDGSCDADHSFYLQADNGKAVAFSIRELTGDIEISSVLQGGIP